MDGHTSGQTAERCEHWVTVPLEGDVARHRCVACGRIDWVSAFHVLGVLVAVGGGRFGSQGRLL